MSLVTSYELGPVTGLAYHAVSFPACCNMLRRKYRIPVSSLLLQRLPVILRHIHSPSAMNIEIIQGCLPVQHFRDIFSRYHRGKHQPVIIRTRYKLSFKIQQQPRRYKLGSDTGRYILPVRVALSVCKIQRNTGRIVKVPLEIPYKVLRCCVSPQRKSSYKEELIITESIHAFKLGKHVSSIRQ